MAGSGPVGRGQQEWPPAEVCDHTQSGLLQLVSSFGDENTVRPLHDSGGGMKHGGNSKTRR